MHYGNPRTLRLFEDIAYISLSRFKALRENVYLRGVKRIDRLRKIGNDLTPRRDAPPQALSLSRSLKIFISSGEGGGERSRKRKFFDENANDRSSHANRRQIAADSPGFSWIGPTDERVFLVPFDRAGMNIGNRTTDEHREVDGFPLYSTLFFVE